MKRNFDNLEIGKSYVSAGDPSDPVRIVRRSIDGNFIGGNGRLYLRDGTCWTGQDIDYLITEVTVTIMPVVLPKVREFWLGFSGNAVEQTFNNENDAKNWVYFCPPESYRRFIHVREVMEGEE